MPEGVFNLIIAKSSVVGDNFAEDKRVPLFSVTGSTAVGKRISGIVGKRLGSSIMELGGNNAIIISSDADLDIAIPAIVFSIPEPLPGYNFPGKDRLYIQPNQPV